MRLIFPFWSGLDSTQHAGFFPVMDRTKFSRHSGRMSFLSLARRRLAHFCFTWTKDNKTLDKPKISSVSNSIVSSIVQYNISTHYTIRLTAAG